MAGAGMGLALPALAGELRKGQKRVILLWLAGGALAFVTAAIVGSIASAVCAAATDSQPTASGLPVDASSAPSTRRGTSGGRSSGAGGSPVRAGRLTASGSPT